MFRTRGEEEIGGKIGEGRTRGFRAINYRDRVGRGARDGKYPVTSGYTEEEGGGGEGRKVDTSADVLKSSSLGISDGGIG